MTNIKLNSTDIEQAICDYINKNMGCKLFSPSELIQFVQKYYHHNLTEDLITYE